MELNDFCNQYKIKPETVKKRLNEIPGYSKVDGKITFEEGTRYPTRKNKSVKTTQDKYYAILHATNKNQYIDHTYIHVTESRFNILLGELLKNGLLIRNETNNKYGANSYDISYKTAEKFSQNKKSLIMALINQVIKLHTVF